MRLSRCSALLPLAALLALAPVAAQGEAGAPPTAAAEVASVPELSAEERLQQQTALKAVWLERLIRAREERHRVSRENYAQALLMATRLGAPAAFVEILRRQAAGVLPARERYALEAAQQELLAAYGVDTLSMRFFVEGCELAPAQLREVVAWLPLPEVFNAPDPTTAPPSTVEEVAAHHRQMLEVFREYAERCSSVNDLASADAAAEAMLPLLARYRAAVLPLLLTPPGLRPEASSTAEAVPVNEAFVRERVRLQEQGWFGSCRLQALDYLLR